LPCGDGVGSYPRFQSLGDGSEQAALHSPDAPRLLAEERGRHSDPKPVPYTPEEAERLIAELYRRDPQYSKFAQQTDGIDNF